MAPRFAENIRPGKYPNVSLNYTEPDTIGQLLDGVGHGRFALMAGAAHYPNMECPEEFAELLLGFLRETEGR